MQRQIIPNYIYQMLDHIYISDHRGFFYSSLFDIIINTTYLQKSNSLEKNVLSHTIQYTCTKKKDVSGNIITELCDIIMNGSNQHKKMLLYSDDYESSVLLFYTYVTTRYHFTPMDVQHIITTRPLNKSLDKNLNKLQYAM
jgi:hypothetical protein